MDGIDSLDSYKNLAKDELAHLKRVDITRISVCGENAAERLVNYIREVHNPYYYRVGNTPVRISFAEGGKPLEEILVRHFISLKQKSFISKNNA